MQYSSLEDMFKASSRELSMAQYLQDPYFCFIAAALVLGFGYAPYVGASVISDNHNRRLH